VRFLLLFDEASDTLSSMQRLQAYQYELIPDGQQKRSMSRFAGSCRFVYNDHGSDGRPGR